MQTIFADSIHNIAVTGPLVRIELATAALSRNGEGKQEVRMEPSQQIVMPLEGFVRAVGIQEQIVRRLVADGIVKVQPQENSAATTTPQ